jgi:hypothetical protein
MAFDIPSLKDSVHPDEWQLRVDLAACYRLVARHGMADLIYNHITARVPGEEGHFLINRLSGITCGTGDHAVSS